MTAATTSIPQPEISVVVPCHNERDNLRPLADAIRKALHPLKRSYEVVLVDDGSSDGSWDLLQKMCAEDRSICGLRLGFQSGQSAAMWAGMRSARGDVIITLDADLQNPPEEIPRIIDEFDKGHDLVGTYREGRKDNLFRRAASWTVNRFHCHASGGAIHPHDA